MTKIKLPYIAALFALISFLFALGISYNNIFQNSSWFNTLINPISAGDKSSITQTSWTIAGFFLAAFGLSELIEKLNRKIAPGFLMDRSEKILITLKLPPAVFDISFSVVNRGNKSLKPEDHVYFQLLIPSEIFKEVLYIKYNGEGNLIGPLKRENSVKNGYVTIGGIINDAIHPKRCIEQFKIKMSFSKIGKYKILYFFNTENGFYPKKYNEINLTGLEELEIDVENQLTD
ncbi:MAG: hypothetical protein WC843_03385 [Candidatus Gracilibacteria bacterium]|jgi:hypothetical protein